MIMWRLTRIDYMVGHGTDRISCVFRVPTSSFLIWSPKARWPRKPCAASGADSSRSPLPKASSSAAAPPLTPLGSLAAIPLDSLPNPNPNPASWSLNTESPPESSLLLDGFPALEGRRSRTSSRQGTLSSMNRLLTSLSRTLALKG